MANNVSFNFSSNVSVNGKKLFSTKGENKQKMSAQEEYWLNRILRDHSGQIFFVVILFFLLMFAVVYIASKNGGTDTSKAYNKEIEFNLK